MTDSIELCESCVGACDRILDLGGDLVAARRSDDGRWSLIDLRGHDQVLVTFDAAPEPDPVPDDDEAADAAFEADPDLWERSERWLATARAAMTPLSAGWDLRGAWRFVDRLVAAGYDPEADGDAELWLYGRVGERITAELLR